MTKEQTLLFVSLKNTFFGIISKYCIPWIQSSLFFMKNVFNIFLNFFSQLILFVSKNSEPKYNSQQQCLLCLKIRYSWRPEGKKKKFDLIFLFILRCYDSKSISSLDNSKEIGIKHFFLYVCFVWRYFSKLMKYQFLKISISRWPNENQSGKNLMDTCSSLNSKILVKTFGFRVLY